MGLSLDEVKYLALLETLGGEDLLCLMIGARDFEPYYNSNSTGLQFIFGEPERQALFVPMSVAPDNWFEGKITIGSSTNSFYSAETYYWLGVTVSTENITLLDQFKLSFVRYVTGDLTELTEIFEELAKVALSFN
jgi:hypothetical protein